jgi:hypothetical protein
MLAKPYQGLDSTLIKARQLFIQQRVDKITSAIIQPLSFTINAISFFAGTLFEPSR